MEKSGFTVANLTTLHQVSLDLGISRQLLGQQARRPGFPFHETTGGRMYDVEEVREWRASNIRQKLPEPSRSPRALADPDDPNIAAMMSGKASAVEISRMAMQLASRRVAMAAIDGSYGQNDFDDLKKTLQELRQAEVSHIELDTLKRERIPADDVRSIVGYGAACLVRCLTVLENSISTELSAWIGDSAVQAMSAEARSRKVREFVARTCAEVRRFEAKGLDDLLRDVSDDDGDVAGTAKG